MRETCADAVVSRVRRVCWGGDSKSQVSKQTNQSQAACACDAVKGVDHGSQDLRSFGRRVCVCGLLVDVEGRASKVPCMCETHAHQHKGKGFGWRAHASWRWLEAERREAAAQILNASICARAPGRLVAARASNDRGKKKRGGVSVEWSA